MIAVGATADLNEDPTDFEYVKSTICHALKDEEFENMLLETASDESFEVNQKAVDPLCSKQTEDGLMDPKGKEKVLPTGGHFLWIFCKEEYE